FSFFLQVFLNQYILFPNFAIWRASRTDIWRAWQADDGRRNGLPTPVLKTSFGTAPLYLCRGNCATEPVRVRVSQLIGQVTTHRHQETNKSGAAPIGSRQTFSKTCSCSDNVSIDVESQ